MTHTTFTWLGHTTLSLPTADGGLLLQPFFTKKSLWLNRLTERVDPLPFAKTRHVIFANASIDRFDAHVLKYFSQNQSVLYVPASIRVFVEKFFQFQNIVTLEHQSPLPIDGMQITPVATPQTCLRFAGLHTQMFHFVIEHNGQTTLVLSDVVGESDILQALTGVNKIDTVFVPISKLGWSSLFVQSQIDFSPIGKIAHSFGVNAIVPYAFGTYGVLSKPDDGKHKSRFESQMSLKGLSGKIVWPEALSSYSST